MQQAQNADSLLIKPSADLLNATLARKVRHAVTPFISKLPLGSLFVIRALKQNEDKNVAPEISTLISKIIERSKKIEAR